MSDTLSSPLDYSVRDGVAYVTMNRPEALNALNRDLQGALAEAFSAVDRDDDVLAVVLQGAGGRAFSVGGDLKAMASRLDSGGQLVGSAPASAGMRAHQSVAKPGALPGMDEIYACSKPTIAAIDGYAMGGGLELALYCDFRFATRQSVFALPEPKRNLLAGPALIHLSRMVPLGEAMFMELTGARMPAERAHAIGLVQGLFADRSEMDAAVGSAVAELRENSPVAVQFLKRVVREGRDMTVDQHWRFAEMFLYTLSTMDDAREGPRAFVEKRRPNWTRR
ncbi:enoyl-CoA hydratase/isomerase family protein [Pseudonocardia oroxyli]|uniref:Crotonobetainyl-CoA hydratase/dehydration protein DpgD n=1 Tax=Pseudonocardia oroxyli TaxID=366584 RepID=A0A1G7TK82_PSEOR|nr:enoyl-CoA hydratase-related protein [Pseudonocardia oroxyli]SDG35743.1 crotonobetainyl-CoA hydratase/dehydration protein DpgD [Pseudonocardia oroxyli]